MTHGYYNLTKFRQNWIINKKVFIIAHFCKQTAEKTADIKKGNKYDANMIEHIVWSPKNLELTI